LAEGDDSDVITAIGHVAKSIGMTKSKKKICIFTKKLYMTFEKTYEIQKDNRLIIKLPDRFKSKKRVKVIIEDVDESRQDRIEMLKKASKDPLFLSDINEITSDFGDSDNELL
jgi:hypothetical protein